MIIWVRVVLRRTKFLVEIKNTNLLSSSFSSGNDPSQEKENDSCCIALRKSDFYLTSHMCDVSICCVTSHGRILLPSKGPIHVPVGMCWLVYTPYPSPAELETSSLHSGGSDLKA